MYAPLRRAIWPTFRTRPRLHCTRLPLSHRTFRITAVGRLDHTPSSDPNNEAANGVNNAPNKATKKEAVQDGDEKNKENEKSSNAAEPKATGSRSSSDPSREASSRLGEFITKGGRSTPSRPRRLHERGRNGAPANPELELPPWFVDRCVVPWDAVEETSPGSDIASRTPFFTGNITPDPNKIVSTPSSWPHTPKESNGVVVSKYSNLKAWPSVENSEEDRVSIDPHLYTEISAVVKGSFAVVSGNARNTFWGLKANLALYCAFDGGTPFLNSVVNRIARDQHADILRFDAMDIQEIAGAYVSTDGLDFLSLRTLAFDTYQAESQEEQENDGAEEEPDEEEEERGQLDERLKTLHDKLSRHKGSVGILVPQSTNEGLQGLPHGLADLLKNSPFMSAFTGLRKEHRRDLFEPSPPIDHARLSIFWDTVIDAALAQRATHSNLDIVDKLGQITTNDTSSPSLERDTVGKEHNKHFNGRSINSERKLIIRIEDFMNMSATPVGEQLLENLVGVIQRRRGQHGEKIMIVGTSSTYEIASEGEPQKTLETESEGSYYRTILVTPQPGINSTRSLVPLWANVTRQRNAYINLRNILWIHNQLGPNGTSDLPESLARYDHILSIMGNSKLRELRERVLKQEEAQRIALTMIGMREPNHLEDGPPTIVNALDTTLSVLRHNDRARASRSIAGYRNEFEDVRRQFESATEESTAKDEEGEEAKKAAETKARLEVLKMSCDKHEAKLFGGIVHPGSIKTTFNDVHVAPETVDAVRTLTSLSLLRPDAFKYGVLATDNISGLLLYGPPGTGKTLLAKAVAKESGATVLTVSGSDINQKYVGESEKVVKAIFSLARKLVPCVVFIDEADALLGARQGGNSRRASHRDTINQLLLEWDGLDPMGVFLMVATNRPFDLDDAVLRRLPRRVLVDLPTKQDREAILRIHLKDELVEDSVSIPDLAEQTPYYSGSDLKNLAVSAALSFVKEENEAKRLAEANGIRNFEYVERRTLTKKHFDQAIGEIAASISADMSSLKDIRKFDEQYGDRKGRKKKNAWGFGQEAEREESARVRG